MSRVLAREAAVEYVTKFIAAQGGGFSKDTWVRVLEDIIVEKLGLEKPEPVTKGKEGDTEPIKTRRFGKKVN